MYLVDSLMGCGGPGAAAVAEGVEALLLGRCFGILPAHILQQPTGTHKFYVCFNVQLLPLLSLLLLWLLGYILLFQLRTGASRYH
jgi:hypothetical protein